MASPGYVIIGGGVAAVGCIEGIRSKDARTPITLISREPYPVYGRPLIAEVLKGEREPEQIVYRPESFYRDNGVECLLGEIAERIDTEGRKVILGLGREIPYRKCLIATGGVPFVPPMDGLNGPDGKWGPDIYTFTTLDDAKGLITASSGMKQAVVVGGGLIGLKVAEGLHDRGVKVSIVELADRILSMAFDAVAGEIVLKRLTDVGLSILTRCSVKTILRDGSGRVRGVVLSDGRELPCQAVVVAIGVVPNKKLAADSGLKVDRGIEVDAYLRTSDPNVYAAGDVASAYDISIKGNRVVPIWPNAYLQGKRAGMNMAGARAKYEGGLPMNSIAFYGIPTISAGVSNPPPKESGGNGYEVLQAADVPNARYRKIVLKGGRLVGYVLVGEVARAGLLTGLIRDGAKSGLKVKELGPDYKARLLAGDFGYMDLPAEIRKRRLT